MLNCREITQRASDFVDGGLPWRDRVQMWLHLRLCQVCREYVRQMALVVDALRRLPRNTTALEPAVERVRAVVRREHRERR